MPVPTRKMAPTPMRTSPAVDAVASPLAVTVATLAIQISEILTQLVALKAVVLDNDEAVTQYEELLARARATVAEAQADRDAQLIGMAAQSLPGAHDA